MLKIYGSMLCPDCVACRKELEEAGIAYTFLDFGESLANLKEFLRLRDQSPLFDRPKKYGKIGIPCIVDEKGDVTLQWEDVLKARVS